MALTATRLSSSYDLSPSERSFVMVLQQLGFGHLESIKVRRGALVLDPWPTVVQVLKFGAAQTELPLSRSCPSADVRRCPQMSGFERLLWG
jgi:hypothetical protein